MAQIIGLHGSPLIARAVYPVVATTCVGERVKVTFEGRGLRRVRRERIRPQGTITLSLTPGQLLGLLSDVSTPTWTLAARVATSGEVGDPVEMTVRTVSDLPLTGPLGLRFRQTGGQAIRVVLGWRSTLTYTRADLGLTT